MNPIRSIACALLAIALSLASSMSHAAGPAKANKATRAAPAPTQREVSYHELENHVGARVVVQTTNETTRSGTLLKYTNVSLLVQLGPEAGAIELSLPRKTVRTVWVSIAPADPLFPGDTLKQDADSGAKKN